MGTLVTEDGRYIDFGDPEENIRQKLESIKKSVDSLVLDNKALRSQIKGFNKDVAIKAKDDEIRSIYQRSIAVLSPVEYERAKTFREKHYQSFKNNRYIYDLEGTGIGTIVKIKCPVCGEEKDITDLDSW